MRSNQQTNREKLAAKLVLVGCIGSAIFAAYAPPAGERPVVRGQNGAAILPGGRVVQPLGQQFVTGPGTWGLAISPSGRSIATANLGPERSSITVFEQDKRGAWSGHNLLTARSEGGRESDLRSLFFGIAFSGEKQLWVAEGESGRVRLIDAATGAKRKLLDLNSGNLANSFASALALDAKNGLLYVVDQAHFRVAIYDFRSGAMVSSVSVGYLPFALALSPDSRRLYVTNVGLFRYHALPGTSGIPFPAFGFPSPDAASLGDPNSRESSSVCVIDVSDPA